jgi:hypothetical protein
VNIAGPTGRFGHAMGTLGSNVVLFGGTTGFGVADMNDTWVYSGTSWSNPTPTTKPGKRDSALMATLGSKLVMFGGEQWTGSGYLPLGDTYTWDGTNWTKVTGTGPGARYYSAMATLNNEIVLFGGVDNQGATVGDTWVFDGSAWTKKTISGGPSARCGHAMATR